MAREAITSLCDDRGSGTFLSVLFTHLLDGNVISENQITVVLSRRRMLGPGGLYKTESYTLASVRRSMLYCFISKLN